MATAVANFRKAICAVGFEWRDEYVQVAEFEGKFIMLSEDCDCDHIIVEFDKLRADFAGVPLHEGTLADMRVKFAEECLAQAKADVATTQG